MDVPLCRLLSHSQLYSMCGFVEALGVYPINYIVLNAQLVSFGIVPSCCSIFAHPFAQRKAFQSSCLIDVRVLCDIP